MTQVYPNERAVTYPMVKGSPGSGARPGSGRYQPRDAGRFAAAKVLVEGLNAQGPSHPAKKSRALEGLDASLTWRPEVSYSPEDHTGLDFITFHHWHRRQVPTLKAAASGLALWPKERAFYFECCAAAATRPRMSPAHGRRGWGCRRGGCSRFRACTGVCAVFSPPISAFVARHDDHVHRHGGKQDEANNNFPHSNSFWVGFVQSKARLRRRAGLWVNWHDTSPLMEQHRPGSGRPCTPLSNDQSLA